MSLELFTIDVNRAIQQPQLIHKLRQLTLYDYSGLNMELDSFIEIGKRRTVKAKIIIAQLDKKMVGWCLVSREPSDFGFVMGDYERATSKKYVLFECYVEKKCRGKGIGSALFDKARKTKSITEGLPFAVAPSNRNAYKFFKNKNGSSKFKWLDNGSSF